MRHAPLIALSALGAAVLLAVLCRPADWQTSTPDRPAVAATPSSTASVSPAAPPQPAVPPGTLASQAASSAVAGASAPVRPDMLRLPQESLANLVQRATARQDPALAVAALKASRLCSYAQHVLAAMDRAIANAPGQAFLLESRQAVDRQVRDCQSLSAAEVGQLPALGHLALRARAEGVGEVLPGLLKPEQLDEDERLAAREVLQRELLQCRLNLLDPLVDWKELALAPLDLERYRQARLLHAQAHEARIPVRGEDGTLTNLATYNAQRLQAQSSQTAGLSPAQREQALREAKALLKRCEDAAGQAPGQVPGLRPPASAARTSASASPGSPRARD